MDEAAEVRFRITLFCLSSRAATMLLVAPSPGSRAMSEILARASNKFRMRARRVFVSGSGIECDALSIGAQLRDGLELVVSSGAKYEMQSATGSPLITGAADTAAAGGGAGGGDGSGTAPLQLGADCSCSEDGQREAEAEAGAERLTAHEAVSVDEELKMESLELLSEAGSAARSLDDGKSEEGEGEGRQLLTASPPHAARTASCFPLSLTSSLPSLGFIPTWLLDQRKQPALSTPTSASAPPPPTAASLPGSAARTAHLPLRDSEEKRSNQSPSPQHSSSSSASSCSASPSQPLSLLQPGSSSGNSSFAASASTSSSPSLSSQCDDEPSTAVLQSTVRLRDAVRQLDDRQRAVRRLEAEVKALRRSDELHREAAARQREAEAAVKDWQERYADSEERLCLQLKATEKAGREKEALRLKHAAVLEKLGRAQAVKGELEALQREHRLQEEEMAHLRGKDMEERSVLELQGLLAWHQQMTGRLHSVLLARMEAERREVSERWTCRVCMERSISVMLQPCHHCVTCQPCAQLLQRCPVCREPIAGKLTLYVG